MRRSVLRKTPCRVGRQYKGFASLDTGLQAACSPLDFLLRSANISTLISVSGNEREYHCTRQKVRLRHCCPPCSLCCRVASVACSFSKVRLRLVILLGSCPDSHVTRSCEWRFPSENSSTSFESWYRWRHKVLQRSTSVRYRTAMPPFRSSYAIFPPLSSGWLHFRWCCSSQSRTALQP